MALSLQLSGNAAMVGLGCLVEVRPRGVTLDGHTTEALNAVIYVLARVVAVAALAGGQGRSRYLASRGLWGSVLFIVAIGATTVAASCRCLCGA